MPYSPDAPFTTVDLADVAEVAADALTGHHLGVTLDLAGPEVLTTREMAEQAASALGRPVMVRHTSVAEWVAGPGAALPGSARDALVAMFRAYDESGLVGDPAPLAAALGRPPTTWLQCVSRSA